MLSNNRSKFDKLTEDLSRIRSADTKKDILVNFKSLISLNGTKVEKNIGYSVKLKKDEISWSEICLIWTLIICRGDVLVVLMWHLLGYRN